MDEEMSKISDAVVDDLTFQIHDDADPLYAGNEPTEWP